MKKATNMLPIDKEKLYRALRKQGVTPSKASRVMGYGSTYLKNSADRGTIHKAAVKLLGGCYGIEYGEYQKVES